MLLKPEDFQHKMLGAMKIEDFPVIPAEAINQNLRAPMVAALEKGVNPAENSVVPINLMCSLLHTLEVLQRDASHLLQILVVLRKKGKYVDEDLVTENEHVKNLLEVIHQTATASESGEEE